MSTIVIGMLALAALLTILRVLRRGSVADRVIGLDMLLLVVVALVAVDAAGRQSGEHLELPPVVGLLGSLSTVDLEQYIGFVGVECHRQVDRQGPGSCGPDQDRYGSRPGSGVLNLHGSNKSVLVSYRETHIDSR